MLKCAHGRGHGWMRSSARTLAAVDCWTTRGQFVGAGEADEFPKRRDRVESPGLSGGGGWSWRFGLILEEEGGGVALAGKRRGDFTFLGGEQEGDIACLGGYGEGGGEDDRGEEVGRIDQERSEVEAG